MRNLSRLALLSRLDTHERVHVFIVKFKNIIVNVSTFFGFWGPCCSSPGPSSPFSSPSAKHDTPPCQQVRGLKGNLCTNDLSLCYFKHSLIITDHELPGMPLVSWINKKQGLIPIKLQNLSSSVCILHGKKCSCY